MKIEICEQMVQSWLQHIKDCQVVQTNWMISPLREITNTELSRVDAYMKDIAQELNTMVDEELKAAIALRNEIEFAENASMASLGSECDESDISELAMYQNMMDCFAVLNQKERNAIQNIFGKSTPEQFVRQCEIDVVGIKLPKDNCLRDFCQVEKIYLVDSAFHKGTLGYKDAAARVLKKIIRAIIVAELVFGTRVPIEIAFTTPNCTPGLNTKINDLKNLLDKVLTKLYGNKYEKMEIKLYFNEFFAKEIYVPLRKEIDKLNNDNDLFMRSMNLAKVAEEKLPVAMKPVALQGKSKPNKKRNTGSFSTKKSGNVTINTASRSSVYEQTKPGMLAQTALRKVLESGNVLQSEIDKLLDKEYCAIIFGLSYALLSQNRDTKQYYSDPVIINGKEYFICNDWRERHKERLIEWLDKHP